MKKLKPYLQKWKITARYLADETDYRYAHISRVIHGKTGNSTQFAKLVRVALQKKLDEKWAALSEKRKDLEQEQRELDAVIRELEKNATKKGRKKKEESKSEDSHGENKT